MAGKPSPCHDHPAAEAELDELVRLVGMDALPYNDRLLMQAAKMMREDFASECIR